MTLHNISAVLFSNILNKNDKEIIKLIFTALTPISCGLYSIQRVKAYQGISLFRQSDTLTQVDHIHNDCVGDEA